jgi:hypothetical protein
MGVEAEQPGMRVNVAQQPARPPGILGGYERHTAQRLRRPRREISEMTERGGDDEERARRHQAIGHGSRS